MATEAILRTLSLPANTDLSTKQYYCVVINSSGKVAVAGDGARVDGILQDTVAAADRAACVAVAGKSKVVFGGTVTAGDRVASDAAGKVVTAGTGDYVIGICVEGGASGKIGSIVFEPNGIWA